MGGVATDTIDAEQPPPIRVSVASLAEHLVDQLATQSIVACIVNERARSAEAKNAGERIKRLFAEQGANVETVVTRQGRDLIPIARRLAEAGHLTIVAAGGDGTVSAVASALIGTKASLGILPLGTLNHFAKDVGIPLDLGDAVKTIMSGERKLVDVGEINGRTFVNNSSIGLYPAIVQRRDEHQSRGVSKWIAFVRAMYTVLRRMPSFHADLRADGKFIGAESTPFVFVGNNAYETAGLEIGTRQRLDGARLWVCVAPHSNPITLIRLAIRAVLGRPSPGELKAFPTQELWVHTKRNRRIKVAADGEVYSTFAPLHYRLHPKVLSVIVPGTESEDF
jgi:diacylglycerol kinase family enzyme